MKKTINHKTYNTETATEIATAGNCSFVSEVHSNFSAVYLALYRTKDGAYFVLEAGGANTIYNKRVARNEYVGNETIRPVTVEEAAKWCHDIKAEYDVNSKYWDGPRWSVGNEAEYAKLSAAV